MNRIDTNSANFGNNSAPYYHPNLVKSHSHYQKQSDDSKEYSEELGIINYSYENLKAAQGLENNNLLESHNTSEEKFEDMAPLSSLMFPNRICNSIILIIYSCY
jgi:hypothetical protein